jgi:tRNA-specific 2-thiouridylase
MSDNSQKKVIVGMSGGVDSSVSAYLLQQQGYKVEGLFMKNWEEDDGEEYCTAAADLADAQAVCDKLGIELHTVNFAAEYWDNVLSFPRRVQSRPYAEPGYSVQQRDQI